MRNVFLVGVSVFALGIGSAAAEETTVEDTGSYNANDIVQDAAGTDSSVTVTQSQDGWEDGVAARPLINGLDGEDTTGLNVYIRQTSTTADSVITVEQVGNRPDAGANAASVIQSVDAEGAFSEADVFQDGLQNAANVLQAGEGQVADVDQNGTLNVASVDQSNMHNEATVMQTGDDNSAVAMQTGMDNVANIIQDTTGADLVMDDFNEAMLEQGGSMNMADIEQSGDGNYANVLQSGMNGMTDLMQTGNANDIDVDQLSNDGIITIQQGGDMNMAMVTQAIDAGMGATVDIMQDGSNGYTKVYQGSAAMAVAE